jgi:hypothetical protein
VRRPSSPAQSNIGVRGAYFDTIATIFLFWASTISTWPFTSA